MSLKRILFSVICLLFSIIALPSVCEAAKKPILLIGDSRLAGMYDSEKLNNYYVLAQESSGWSSITSDCKFDFSKVTGGIRNTLTGKTSGKVDIKQAVNDKKITTIVYMMGRNDLDVNENKETCKVLKDNTGCNIVFAYCIPDSPSTDSNNKYISEYNVNMKSYSNLFDLSIDLYSPMLSKKRISDGLHYSDYTPAIKRLKEKLSDINSSISDKSENSNQSSLDYKEFGNKFYKAMNITKNPNSKTGAGFDDATNEFAGEQAYLTIQFLITKGWTDEAMTGVFLNWTQESAIIPYAVEGSPKGVDWLKQVAKNKNNSIDDKKFKSGIISQGIGVGQWTDNSNCNRKTNFIKYFKDAKLKLEDYGVIQVTESDGNTFLLPPLAMQAEFLMDEDTWNDTTAVEYKNEAIKKYAEIQLDEIPDTLKDYYSNEKLAKKCGAVGMSCLYLCFWESPSTDANGTYDTEMSNRSGGAEEFMECCQLVRNGEISGSGDKNKDKANAKNLAEQLNATGAFTEEQLGQFCKLNEIDIQDVYIKNATRDNLSQSELNSLIAWEDNIERSEEQTGIISWVRTLITFLGILFIVWVVLIYGAYWFDRTNNFFEFSVLGLLTAHKLMVSDTESTSTYSLGLNSKSKQPKMVNHSAMLKICLISILFGLLIVSGKIYTIIKAIIGFATNVISVLVDSWKG